MYARITSGIVLAVFLATGPIALAGDKGEGKSTTAVKKETSSSKKATAAAPMKKGESRSTAWHGKDWKSSATPTVRPIVYQGSTTRPSAAVATRPANDYTFRTSAGYDYFADHYGTSTSRSSDVMGYVSPEKTSSNSGNPFIYRRAN